VKKRDRYTHQVILSNNDIRMDQPTNQHQQINIQQTFTAIFTKSNIVFLFWFLAIYFVLYFILHISSATPFFSVSRMFDILLFGFIVFYCAYFYSTNSAVDIVNRFGTQLKTYLDDPLSIFATSLFIFVLYLIIFFFGISMTYGNKSIAISIVENIAWIGFILVLIVDVFRYGLGIDIVTFVSDLLSGVWTTIPTESPPTTPITDISHNEVFHISNNLYNYADAQAICSSYGAELATASQLESSYQDGADFCSYGWSAGQMALFPTQYATWEKLQTDPKTKNNCGRVGVNGGYFANPNLRFGVNCYGVKPAQTATDYSPGQTTVGTTAPKTQQQVLMDKKVQYFKDNASTMLQLSSFNGTKWNEY